MVDQQSIHALEQIICDSAESLLADNDFSPTSRLEDGEGSEADEVYAAFIGFAGDELRGSVSIAFESKSLTLPTSARDWVGEMSNQLLGRIKSSVLKRGPRIALSTPVAFVCRSLSIHGAEDDRIVHFAFGTPKGRVDVWVCYTAEDSFKLNEASPAPSSTDRGGCLLF